MTRRPGVAIFDLDHTLIRGDSFLSYLLGLLCRRPWRIVRCVHLPIVTVLFWARLVNNAKLKEVYLQAVLGGLHEAEIACWTDRFLNNFLQCRMCRQALATLEVHRRAGDALILVTASPDCYVTELGRRLRFDEVICTHVEWRDGRLSGRLASPNMRGEEKVQAIHGIRSRYASRPITAYADHQSDLAMLRASDHGILVNGGRRARARALLDCIQCVVWLD